MIRIPHRRWKLVLTLAVSLAAVSSLARADDSRDAAPIYDVIVYDDFDAAGYSLADYQWRWFHPYGLGEMALGDTRDFSGGELHIDAAPFQTSIDSSVYDHIKYLALAPAPVPIPEKGSITFSADIDAETPGTIPGRVIEGTYIESGQPYRAVALQGQQACATLHMIDFATGQLFDWLVSGDKALALTERLPSLITGSPIEAGIDEIYTQVIDEFDLTPGRHNFAIRYTKKNNFDEVDFLIDGEVVAGYRHVGIPLDEQGIDFITYPSLGQGELLQDQIDSVSMAHGVFSLLDAFPFQHPDAPEESVSIPVENRIFGQGVVATFDNFVIETKTLQ